jgi:hypothetical protein
MTLEFEHFEPALRAWSNDMPAVPPLIPMAAGII